MGRRSAPATPRRPHRLLPLLPSGPDGVHNLASRGDRRDRHRSNGPQQYQTAEGDSSLAFSADDRIDLGAYVSPALVLPCHQEQTLAAAATCPKSADLAFLNLSGHVAQDSPEQLLHRRSRPDRLYGAQPLGERAIPALAQRRYRNDESNGAIRSAEANALQLPSFAGCDSDLCLRDVQLLDDAIAVTIVLEGGLRSAQPRAARW